MANLSNSDFLVTKAFLGKVYFSDMKASFGVGWVAGLTTQAAFSWSQVFGDMCREKRREKRVERNE